jgi:ketosteroid isomerase-like protein
MSEENVERIRAAYAAYNRLDFATSVAFFHPEAEWHSYLGTLESSVHRGHHAIVEMWSNLAESFGGRLQIEPLEMIDCGGDQVVVVVEGRGTGSGSGMEVRNRWAQLATFRDGLVLRIESFPDRTSAVDAAGQSG